MSINIKCLSFSTLALIILVVSGCSAPKPAGLTDEQVTGVTENVLKTLEAGDYPNFTRDFSDKMKSTFSQAQFDNLRLMLHNASGSYQSMGTPSLMNSQGYAVYRIPAEYTNETVTVTLTFLIGEVKIEGLWFDSAALRKASP